MEIFSGLLDLIGFGGPPNGAPRGPGGRVGPGRRGPGGGNRPKASEGVKIEKSSVKLLKNALYASSVELVAALNAVPTVESVATKVSYCIAQLSRPYPYAPKCTKLDSRTQHCGIELSRF